MAVTTAGTDLYTAFALDLLRAVSASGQDNAVVSPWSVVSALALVAPGADAAARREIQQALAPGAALSVAVHGAANDPAAAAGSDDDIIAALAAHAREMTEARRDSSAGSDDAVLVVANSLWVDENRTPQAAFVRHLERWPGARVRAAALQRDPESVRQAINAAVAETTRDLIPEILPPGSITAQERAVVVNALYLLAGWIDRFAVEDTVHEPFHAPSRLRKVPTMRGRRELSYAPADTASTDGGPADREGGWEYLALPLWPDLTAEVLLPPAGTTNPAAALTPAVLAERREGARRHQVDLHLPRLRLELHVDLGPPLRRLGISRIFDQPALVDVVAEEALLVSGAFHAAVLKVDERGIEGAAATALVARAVAYVELPQAEVRVDRPFLLLVTHRRTGIVLFLAHVAEP